MKTFTTFNAKRKAFTLIELLIVIAIIGILFIVLVSKVDFATDKAKATGVQTDFRSFQVAIESVAKEHAGLATFGWDTGDTNGDRIRNSYDKGDTNKNGKQDDGEVFVGSKTYGETWTNVYTLTNPADANDKSAIVALEEAINKNLDPKLHITIADDLTITMANGAQDPWNTEYHGYYITNATTDGKDRGAIVIYSNGANQEFGCEHSIANGVVTVNVPGNNVYGKDDYSLAVVYTYLNGYGEVKTSTSGFSNNQTPQGNISDNSGTEGTGGTEGSEDLEGTEDPDVTELLEPGLYQAGAIELAKSGNIESAQDMLKTSWSELEASGAIAISEGENIVLPEINEYGFYYGVPYSISDNIGWLASLIFNEDGTASLSNSDGVFPLPAEVIIYGDHYIDLSACNFPCLTVSADGTSLDDGYGSIFYVGSGLPPEGTVYLSEVNGEWPMFDGDLVLPADGRAMIIPEELFINQEFLTGIVIPDSVTSIGKNAFNSCYSLTSITIPDSVTSIGDWVFWWCFSLQNITVDSNNTAYMSIDGNLYTKDGKTLINYAIGKTDTSFTIPDSVTSIGSDAFNNCTSLMSVEIGDSVESIGDSAFVYCTSLTSVVIGDSVESIGSDAFNNCTSLTSVVIPDSVTSIAYGAFSGCDSLTSVTIPDSVKSIDSHVFSSCDSLTNVTIPDSVTSIGDYAFSGCTSLTSVVIPDSVLSLGSSAFRYCDRLTSVEIGDSVKIIGDSAFRDCDRLTSIVIPDSVTSIGGYAFYNCDSLTSVVIGNSVESIGGLAFYNCDSLTSVVIGDSVTSIGDRAFNSCYRLTSIVIPDSVTSIGEGAFAHCIGLTSVVIGDSVTSIGYEAFWDCHKIVEVINKSSLNITAGSPDYEFVAKYAKVVHNGNELTLVKNVDNYLFMTYDGINYLLGYIDTNTDLVLPEKYNGENYEIYNYAFHLRNDLSSVVIPDSVTSIGLGAFENCNSLTSVTIGNGVTSIGKNSFYGCEELTSVTIGNSVTSIGDSAFSYCTGLTNITFHGSVEQWSSISKYSSWKFKTPATYVQCTDGQVTLK